MVALVVSPTTASYVAQAGRVLQVALVEGLQWSTRCDYANVSVVAAQLQHRVPCWGYVMREAALPPRPNLELIKRAGAQPADVLAAIDSQDLKRPIALTNGQAMPAGRLVYPPQRGRKVVLLGDTCNSSAIAGAAPCSSCQGMKALSSGEVFVTSCVPSVDPAHNTLQPSEGWH